ncbi:MAG: hypothetical protein MJK13_01800 [Pseudomonadales bacterium]|nr:hypothetical protein [Pseudomonadales bacterium]
MHALAEFILKGRTQAIVVAAVAALLPLLFWLSAAAVCLVTLRKGATEGGIILVGALVPAIMWSRQGDLTPIIVILGSYILATVLRNTVSWQRTIQASLLLAVIAGLVQQQLNGDVLEQVVIAAQKMMMQASPEMSASLSTDSQWLLQATLGAFDALHFAMMLSSLFLARWWQSKLYNPGGLQQEFHQLRFSPLFALSLLAITVIATSGEGEFIRWVPLLVSPLIIAGLALAHGSVAKRSLGRSWIIALYIAVILLQSYVITVLVILAAIDTLVDIRNKIPASQ